MTPRSRSIVPSLLEKLTLFYLKRLKINTIKLAQVKKNTYLCIVKGKGTNPPPRHQPILLLTLKSFITIMATQDSIQTVKYSLGLRPNPQHEDDPKKVYANLQRNGVVSLAQLAAHIKGHGSPYGRDVIIGVLTAIVDHTREFLTQGFEVDLGELGRFAPSFKQKGAVDFESFTTANFTDYRAIYSMSSAFDDMLSEVKFERVATRKAQAAIVEAEDKGETTADWTAKEEEEGGEGDEP